MASLGAAMLQDAGRSAHAVSSMQFVKNAPIVGPQDGVVIITHTGETAYALAARRLPYVVAGVAIAIALATGAAAYATDRLATGFAARTWASPGSGSPVRSRTSTGTTVWTPTASSAPPST